VVQHAANPHSTLPSTHTRPCVWVCACVRASLCMRVGLGHDDRTRYDINVTETPAPYRFFSVFNGESAVRKGVTELVIAFVNEFALHENVRLKKKFHPPPSSQLCTALLLLASPLIPIVAPPSLPPSCG
jgi:hypothetical protein